MNNYEFFLGAFLEIYVCLPVCVDIAKLELARFVIVSEFVIFTPIKLLANHSDIYYRNTDEIIKNYVQK